MTAPTNQASQTAVQQALSRYFQQLNTAVTTGVKKHQPVTWVDYTINAVIDLVLLISFLVFKDIYMLNHRGAGPIYLGVAQTGFILGFMVLLMLCLGSFVWVLLARRDKLALVIFGNPQLMAAELNLQQVLATAPALAEQTVLASIPYSTFKQLCKNLQIGTMWWQAEPKRTKNQWFALHNWLKTNDLAGENSIHALY